MNTYKKYSKRYPEFFTKILNTKPDYIVPVERKGCKLLRSLQINLDEISVPIRYKQFFDNTSTDIKGKRIAVIDDASKYTSTLFEYRDYFEHQGALVDTYSFVGQEYLQNKQREKYDDKATILQYLNESTYQEYIIQQSIELSKEDNCFDVDHMVFRANLSKERFGELLHDLDFLGKIDCTNDVYTPEFITKLCLYDFTFPVLVPFDITAGIYGSPLQKVRLAYNENTELLSLVPLEMVTWDTHVSFDMQDLFFKSNLLPLYEFRSALKLEGRYMNIIHLCCIYLFKSFLDQVKGFPELKNLTIEDYDLKAYVGLERTNDIKSSIIRFINADSLNAKLYQLQPFDKQYDSFPKFQSVLSVMRHLRNEYERRIYANNSVMGVQYYLPYGELFSRYSGRANLMKWIDILCDRGVFVTRNINFNGVYCRACRSGEADFDHIERKTSILLPIIINACGKRAGDVYRIGATLLNKIIANLAYDYPKDTYDFHNFFTKPYLYGPFTYVANELNDEVVTSLYNVERISKYCLYDEKNKEFVAVAQEYISKDIQAFSQYDMVPFTEITNYVDCLHQISIKFNKADILNQLAICREEDVYYRHVHFDLFTAYNNIVTAYRTQKPEKAERYLRDAAKVANEAAKKLNYNQNELFKSLEETIGADIRYHVAYHKFLESRVEFSVSFTRFLGRLKEIAHIEQVLVNLMLYRNTYNRKYFLKLYKIEDSDKLFDKGITKELKALFDDMQVHANQTDAFLAALDAAIQQLFGKLDIAVKGLPKPNETKYVRAEQKRNIDFAINRSILYIKKKGLPRYALLHFEFSGYRNTEGSKSTNVIERVQQAMEFLTKDAENSLILCGLTGELTCGTVLFDKIEDAVQFAMKIQQLFVEENLDQVEFRFGCSSLKTLPVNSIHTNIKAAWDAAVECSSVRNCNSHFVITGSTYNLLSETTRRSFRMVTSTQGSPEKVYYGSQDFISFDSSQVVCYEENTDDSVEIGIITALTEEFVAVQKMLIEPKTAIFPKPSSAKKTTGREFCVGKVRSVDGKFHRIALTQTIGMGNMSAAVRADSLIEHFPKLDTIIMVGIAGGIPSPCDLNKHVRLGDIVLAESIIQYDFVADKRSIKELRGRDVPPCARLVEAQNALKCGMLMGNRPWESYIDEVCSVIPQFSRPAAETDVLYDARNNVIPHPEDPERTLYPKVFETKIACANRVLKNPKKRDQLMHNYDVHAVEMESGGVADATWEAQIGYYVIRGICDYCDTHKDDQWHNYAALVAAAYARSLIERIPY